ncbi:hypothetical protein TRVL_05281 [Trypanosoma vivax]|nr:hypothetical protein TRVL_05281 [Trypanosoma vivax]
MVVLHFIRFVGLLRRERNALRAVNFITSPAILKPSRRVRRLPFRQAPARLAVQVRAGPSTRRTHYAQYFLDSTRLVMNETSTFFRMMCARGMRNLKPAHAPYSATAHRAHFHL